MFLVIVVHGRQYGHQLLTSRMVILLVLGYPQDNLVTAVAVAVAATMEE